MIFCHQKHKHCFVACCASVLGKNDISSQEDIVNQFPRALQKGTPDEGVPSTTKEADEVLLGLNISSSPKYIISNCPTLNSLTEFLKQNKYLAERIFILKTKPTNHCLRIKEIKDDKLVIMNPQLFDFSDMSWKEFEETEPKLLLLL